MGHPPPRNRLHLVPLYPSFRNSLVPQVVLGNAIVCELDSGRLDFRRGRGARAAIRGARAATRLRLGPPPPAFIQHQASGIQHLIRFRECLHHPPHIRPLLLPLRKIPKRLPHPAPRAKPRLVSRRPEPPVRIIIPQHRHPTHLPAHIPVILQQLHRRDLAPVPHRIVPRRPQRLAPPPEIPVHIF